MIKKSTVTFLFFYSLFVSPAQSQLSNPVNELPGKYFQMMQTGAAKVKERLRAEPTATLASLEATPGWSHFPNAILIPAVLYTKKHPANKNYGDDNQLKLALRIGDFLVGEYDKGHYTARGDNDWDTYMWLEAYRLLENKLGEQRRLRWREILMKEAVVPLPRLARCQDYPWYNAPFIGTSPNHYAIYAATILVAGHVFDQPEWIRLANKVLHRFCVEEQAADGYWGEQSNAGPTPGYNYLTVTQIALYWEYTKDPAALKALRKATHFHQYYTYPDGTPVETINDRNRHWGVSMWGHFGFSNFPDGRRYASFLTGFFPKEGDKKSYGGDMQSLGRIAQNALYYHDGNSTPIPQDKQEYFHKMHVAAGIRKTGPWTVTYSGIIAPPFSTNNFFLDRQSNFSVYNKNTGLIISGANSKHQHELATITEVMGQDSFYMPISSRLQMNEKADRLGLSYNTFFAVLEVPKPTAKQVKFSVTTTHKWDNAEVGLNLQLMLKAGQILETGTGRKIILSKEKIELTNAELGGLIKHNGWTLHLHAETKLQWPVYPFNPYRDGPETELSMAVGRVALTFKSDNRQMSFQLDED